MSCPELRYAQMKYPDIANGDGIRVSLYVQGCHRHCPGCFNPETWDPDGGEAFTARDRERLFEILSKPHVVGLSVLGGEPVEQAEALCELLREVSWTFPEKDIWLWTGYDFEEVQDLPMFEFVDVVVDGAFMEDEKQIDLRYRGSINQRVIVLNPDHESGYALCKLDDGPYIPRWKETVLTPKEG